MQQRSKQRVSQWLPAGCTSISRRVRLRLCNASFRGTHTWRAGLAATAAFTTCSAGGRAGWGVRSLRVQWCCFAGGGLAPGNRGKHSSSDSHDDSHESESVRCLARMPGLPSFL
jgi:hypothetical protein